VGKAPEFPAGPFKRLQAGGDSFPLYMLPFDKKGTCQGPLSYQALLHDLREGDYTHVFVCSHGWNNTFQGALARYEEFITGYRSFREARGLPLPGPYRPVVVGISWPSIDLLLPWEKPPRIAALPGEPVPGAADPEGDVPRAISDLAEGLPPPDASRLRDLASADSLNPQDAAELAGLVARLYPVSGDQELSGADDDEPVTASTVLSVWASLRREGFSAASPRGAADELDGPESFHAPLEDLPDSGAETDAGAGGDPGTVPPAGPSAAGGLAFDPRDIVRAVTVLKMKDRAGLVGSAGVGPLLASLRGVAPGVALHLTGHSYGCRLLLAALSTTGLPRPADSLLLLQPAVNYLCFAGQVPKTGKRGGFRRALAQVRQPVLATFSARDRPLHDYFHLAVRRRGDLGEPKIAAFGRVPSLYCALGGYGPGGMTDDEGVEVPLLAYPQRYDLSRAGVRVYGVRGDAGISGHSDVVNDFTFWALHNQVTG
jgi:hypothetical protein